MEPSSRDLPSTFSDSSDRDTIFSLSLWWIFKECSMRLLSKSTTQSLKSDSRVSISSIHSSGTVSSLHSNKSSIVSNLLPSSNIFPSKVARFNENEASMLSRSSPFPQNSAFLWRFIPVSISTCVSLRSLKKPGTWWRTAKRVDHTESKEFKCEMVGCACIIVAVTTAVNSSRWL